MKIKSSLFALALSAASVQAATLVAGFDFQTTTNGGTAASVSAAGTPSPLVYNANFGSGTLYLDGTNGSSSFTTGVASPQVTSFTGTDINTSGTDFSTTTSGAASLAVANQTANGQRMVFVLSMTNLSDLSISYATQATNTGFNLQEWSWSLDGSTFAVFDSYSPRPAATGLTFAQNDVVSLDTSGLSALNGQDTVYIGVTFSGATAAAGNNRLDNIQFTVIPEPTTALLGGLGMLCLLRRRR